MTPGKRSRCLPWVLRVMSIVGVLSVSAAQCYDDGSEVIVEQHSEPLSFEVVARGPRAAFTDRIEFVVQDAQRWARLQDSLNIPVPAREVGFEQLMVLLAAVPAEGGGYHVQFESVEVFPDHVLAHYALGIPAEDCITTMGTTVPFEAIVVRRVELPVVFERSQQDVRCTFR